MELKRREDKKGGKVINPRNQFLEWNLEAELYAFGRRLNEDFDLDLLLQAFTDRSYVIKEEMKQKELGVEIQMKDNRELADEGKGFVIPLPFWTISVSIYPFLDLTNSSRNGLSRNWTTVVVHNHQTLPSGTPKLIKYLMYIRCHVSANNTLLNTITQKHRPIIQCISISGEKFLKAYIQAYLEHVLPKFPLEGVASVRQHLTSEATLAHVSQHLGTKDVVLASVSLSRTTYWYWLFSIVFKFIRAKGLSR